MVGARKTSGPPGSRYPWFVVGLFWCVYFLNQADRQVIFSVFPLLQLDLGLSNTGLGLLGSSFQWVYAVLVPVAGGVGDILSRRNMITVALLVWSLATLGSGLAAGFAVLLILRALTGAGEAFYYPAATSIISDYHGEKTRAFAMSLHQSSVYVGIICSGALAGYIGQEYGWRAAFGLFGGLGILASFLVHKGIREPNRGASDGAAIALNEALPLRRRLAEAFGNRTAVLLMIAFLGMNFVNVACLAWTPTLLHQDFGLSLAQAGFHATFYHHVGALLGVLIGGRLADRWSERWPRIRPLIQFSGLTLGAPFVFLMGWSDSRVIVFASMGLFGLFRGLYDSNLFATLYEVVRPAARATATGATLAVGFLGGGSAAVAIGSVSGRVGLGPALAGTSVFYLFSATMLLAACLFCFLPDRARTRMAGAIKVSP